jgi:glycerol-3-phosphate dehydrogenase (NAD(P)+)
VGARAELAHEIQEGTATASICPASTCRATCRRRHLSEALDGASQVYLAISSQALRQNLKAGAPARLER